MGIFDKIGTLFQSTRKIDVEARFQRMRSAISGTMSNFYAAKDREHDNRMVGVKLCDVEKVKFFENRFRGLNKPSEGTIAMSMKHPRVVETYEIGMTTRGQPCLIMELVDGPGLQLVIQERNEAGLTGNYLTLIRQMAEALAYVHASGYIHRDICPRNYICTEDLKTIKLIDFGLTVPATPDFMQPGNRTGTPLYMSPEVVRRRSTDQRLDVFSFGITCYHMLTFELPWPVTDTTGKAALHHDTSEPKPITDYRPNIDPQLAATVMQAMQPDPNRRIASMKDFLSQIEKVDSAFVS
jgi:serine/threonine-protein kinase